MFVFVVLGMEPRALYMTDKWSSSESHLQPGLNGGGDTFSLREYGWVLSTKESNWVREHSAWLDCVTKGNVWILSCGSYRNRVVLTGDEHFCCLFKCLKMNMNLSPERISTLKYSSHLIWKELSSATNVTINSSLEQSVFE